MFIVQFWADRLLKTNSALCQAYARSTQLINNAKR